MQKIGNITQTADANGEWTNGNVAAGTAPTILDAAWLNTIQRELINILTVAGIAIDPEKDNQVMTALGGYFLKIAKVGNGTGQIPDMSFFGKTNSYFKLPSGIIVQWGQTGSSASVLLQQNFPIPFPNNCYQVIGSGVDFNNANIIMINPVDRTKYQLVAWVATIGSSNVSRTQTPISWVAIGD
ncbi:gp53-like domain-containing protein [Ewingella sp. S1.OA.A_B6]